MAYIALLVVFSAAWVLWSRGQEADLRVMLYPVAKLVQFSTGMQFTAYQGGYLSADGSILIGNACAGAVFFAMTVMLLALVVSLRLSIRLAYAVLPLCILIGYVATVVAGWARIASSIWMLRLDLFFITFQRAHAILGILAYFGMLLILWNGANAWMGRIKTYGQ